MRNPSYEKEVQQLLAGLPAEGQPAFLHLLSCAECRDEALVRLLERTEGRRVVPAPCQGQSFEIEVLEWLHHGSPDAEELRGELLRLKPKRRTEVVREARFHRLDLLGLLVEASRELLPRAPEQAEEAALLAIDLGAWLPDGQDQRVLAMLLSRAWYLAGMARQILRRDADTAEMCFNEEAFYLTVPFESSDRPRFCQAQGVLRWQRGRLEEAAALLRRSAESFASQGLSDEEGVSLLLLGLLLTEQGDSERAAGPLLRGRVLISTERRLALAARAEAALALCQADLGQERRARRTLEESRCLRGRTQAQDARELSWIAWMEAKAAALLGDPEALALLDAVRRQVLADGLLPEAILVSLDLGLELIKAGETKGIRLLEAEARDGSRRPAGSAPRPPRVSPARQGRPPRGPQTARERTRLVSMADVPVQRRPPGSLGPVHTLLQRSARIRRPAPSRRGQRGSIMTEGETRRGLQCVCRDLGACLESLRNSNAASR